MGQNGQQEMGLRERKKIKTRRIIQQHALRLFQEKGYQETTVEQIADAAEVSPSTFFRYFPTKEDVVLYDDNDPQIIAAFQAQPAGMNVVRALRNAIAEVLTAMSEEEKKSQVERAKLMMTVPEIRAGFLNNLAQMIQMVAEAVADRLSCDSSDMVIRSLAGALMGVGMSAIFSWLENPQLDLMATLDEAMGYIESGFSI